MSRAGEERHGGGASGLAGLGRRLTGYDGVDDQREELHGREDGVGSQEPTTRSRSQNSRMIKSKTQDLEDIAQPRLDDKQLLEAQGQHIEREPRFKLTMKAVSSLALVSALLTWALAALSARSATQAHNGSRQQPVQEYTVQSSWPQHAFEHYYVRPNGTGSEPQPKIYDAKTGGAFPLELTQAYPLPEVPPASEAVYPAKHGHAPANYAQEIKANITKLINGTDSSAAASAKCSTCIAALKQAQKLARRDPQSVPGVLTSLCTQYSFLTPRDGLTVAEACNRTYAPQTLGAQYAQVLSYADFEGEMPSDAQVICKNIVGASSGCSMPPPVDLHANGYLDKWFGGKQKRSEIQARSQHPSKTGSAHTNMHGKKQAFRVLHMSDIHVDPRFFVGSEGACTSGQCCRADSYNSTVAQGPPKPEGNLLPKSNTSEAAAYWGNYRCDVPWSLALAALESVTSLNGGSPVDMSLYTGDMVTHDSSYHLSDTLVRYTQQAIFDTMKKYLGHGPVFSAIGNHDTAPSDSSAPRDLPDEAPRDEFSYDWSNLKRLFEAECWFTHDEAKQVAQHYGGYSISPRKGLRIITLNTDFWYKSNVYNFINSTNPDTSGILRFLTDELERAEGNNERVWIVGHVLTGWDGSNPLPNPTNLFYQIVTHYAPRTIAHIFFGHTHEDQFNVFYANNGTDRMTRHAKTFSFIGPSVTPLTNVNSAIRLYTVDPETYEVLDYDQYYSQVKDFADLPKSGHGPVWQHLYSARETYGTFNASAFNGAVGNGTVKLSQGNQWPTDAPLNATFWSALTDEMQARPALLSDVFHHYQGRNSPRTKACNSTCVEANLCYMRSGSAILGQQCPQGYGSVQGG